MKILGGFLFFVWGGLILIGGNLGYINPAGEFKVFEELTGNTLAGWLFILVGLDGMLPGRLSPFNFLEEAMCFLINLVTGEKRVYKNDEPDGSQNTALKTDENHDKKDGRF